MKKRNVIAIIIVFILLALMTYSYFTQGIIYQIINLDSDRVVDLLAPFKGWAFVVYFLIMILEVVVAPFHPFPFYVAGAMIFGPFLAGVLACLGGAIGGAIAFWIAKKWGRRHVEKIVSKERIEKFDNFSKKHGGLSVFLLRVNPLTSTDLWSYVAGVSKISFWKFMIGTFIGLIPAIFIQVYIGIPIKNNPILFKLFMVGILLYLIIAIFLIFWIRKSSQKNQALLSQGSKRKHGRP